MAISYLERFGDVLLPRLEAETDLDTDDTLPRYEILPHGFIDLYGDDETPWLPTTLTAQGIMDGRDKVALQVAFDALRAKQGYSDQLFLRNSDDTVRRRWATLRKVEARRVTDSPHMLLVEMQFEGMPGGWRGDLWGGGWTLDDGIYLDRGYTFDPNDSIETLTGSPFVFTVTNGGNAVVDNAVITVTAGDANITALTVGTGDAEWTYTGTIGASDSLVVDVGAMAVTNEGADAYDDFSLTANHAEQLWFPIQPGNNTVTVTYTGGGTGSTILVLFWDRWK